VILPSQAALNQYLKNQEIPEINKWPYLWLLSIFKPAAYREFCFQQLKKNPSKSFMELFLISASLLSINSFFIILLGVVTGNGHLFLVTLIASFSIQLNALLISPNFYFADKKFPEEWSPVNEQLSSVGIAVALLLAWVTPMFIWNMTLNTKLVIGGFILGLAIGSGFGISNNITAQGKKIHLTRISLIFSTMIGLFIMGLLAPSEYQTNVYEYKDVWLVNKIAVPFDVMLTNIESQTNLNLGAGSSIFDPSLSNAAVYLAVVIILMFATFVGILLGKRGWLQWVIGTPYALVAYYKIEKGDFEGCEKVLQKLALFEHWQQNKWWGERECLERLLHYDKNKYLNLALSKLFWTGRHNFGLELLRDYLDSVDATQAIYVLVSLLPFAEFNSRLFDFVPSITFLQNNQKDWFFSEILLRRQRIFADILMIANENTTFDHENIIRAFDNIASLQFAEEKDLIVKKCVRIARYLKKYQTIPNIKQFVILADVVRSSLKTTNADEIGITALLWHELYEIISDETTLSTYKGFSEKFSNFAQAIQNISIDNNESIGMVALHSLLIRLSLEKRDKGRDLFGINIFLILATHWESLFHSFLEENLMNK